MSNEFMTIEDIMKNKELAVHTAEDIDDIPEDTQVTYEVWALGYKNDESITDTEMLLSEFADPDAAVEYAKTVSLADILNQAADEYDGIEPTSKPDYLAIEVETVIEDEDESTMNIGTIYKRDLWLDGECDDDNLPEDEYSNVVSIQEDEYTLLEDGSIKVKCDILKGFNKNDTVQLMFVGEDNMSILTYRIISKVIYADGDYYHCEFIY